MFQRAALIVSASLGVLACGENDSSSPGSGGSSSTGGSAGSGGATATSGGSKSSGGSSSGGSSSGGSSSGGSSSGGQSSGGSSNQAGKGGTAGAAGGSSAGSGGLATSGSSSGAGGGSAGAATGGGAGASGTNTCPAQCYSSPASSQNCAPCFSFFATSLEAMRQLSGNQNGFGGDLRFGATDGLTGADKICRTIAADIVKDPMTISGLKTWRAFLSVTSGPNMQPVHAKDRVGMGPWYDRTGRLLSANLTNLLKERPAGADPAIKDDFPNEEGIPNHGACAGCSNEQCCDNHDFMTGTGADGQLYTGAQGQSGGGQGGGMFNCTGIACTCQDWTSKVGNGGKPWCGHSWPRQGSGVNWMASLAEAGCAPGVFLNEGGGPTGDTVGGGGGYGGIYCFAILPAR